MSPSIPVCLANQSITAITETGTVLISVVGTSAGTIGLALAVHSTVARRARHRLGALEDELTSLLATVTPHPARPITTGDLQQAVDTKPVFETAGRNERKLRELLAELCRTLEAAQEPARAALALRNGRERDQRQQQLGACAGAIRKAAHAARERVRELRSR
ncbi:hypothetical protein ACSYGO_16980 [Streptomyces krungchingensis]|uniref:hypothetical protein n=1 Tax=Streptomyces sp. Tue6028 TaxID=2036037 RepID=UPI003D7283F7